MRNMMLVVLVVLAVLIGAGSARPARVHAAPGLYGLTPTLPATPTPTSPAPATTTPVPTETTPEPTPTPKRPLERRHTATPTATPTATATPEPWTTEIRLTKTADRVTALPGDVVQYTLRAENLGTHTAFDVVVTDRVPEVLEVIDLASSQGDVVVSGQQVTAYPSVLAPGEPVTIRVTARVRADAASGTVTNVAQITTTTIGDDPGNNTSIVTLTIGTVPPRLPITADPPPDALTALGPYLPWMGLGVLLMVVGSLITLLVSRRTPRPVGGAAVDTAPTPPGRDVAAPARVPRSSVGSPLPMPIVPQPPPHQRLPNPQPPTPLPPRVALDRGEER